MTAVASPNRLLRLCVPGIAVVVVYAAVLAVLASELASAAPRSLSIAAAIDLTVTAAALVWLLGVRPGRWPRWTIGTTLALGILVAHRAVPDRAIGQGLLAGVVLVELSIFALMLVRLSRVVRVARSQRQRGPIAALEAGFEAAGLPAALAEMLASEVIAITFGLFGWFRRTPSSGFSTHRRRSWSLICGVFLFLVLLEASVLHLLIAPHHPMAAWVLTALSLYGGLWIAADLHLTRLTPIRIDRDHLHVHVGVRWRATIPRSLIVNATPISQCPPETLAATNLSPTILLEFSEPTTFRGPYALRRRASAVALTVDEPSEFLAELNVPRGQGQTGG